MPSRASLSVPSRASGTENAVVEFLKTVPSRASGTVKAVVEFLKTVPSRASGTVSTVVQAPAVVEALETTATNKHNEALAAR